MHVLLAVVEEEQKQLLDLFVSERSRSLVASLVLKGDREGEVGDLVLFA